MNWISVNDRLPEMRTTVLIYSFIGRDYGLEFKREKDIFTAYFTNDYRQIEWIIDCHCSGYERDLEYFEPTHWMPLPEPPDE